MSLLLLLLQGCSALSIDDNSGGFSAAKIEKIDMLSHRAETAYQAKQFQKSADIWKQVVEIDSENVQALYRLGNTSFRMGDMMSAREYFERAVDISPRHSKAHYNLAVISLVIAEQHLQFYAATTDPSTDIENVTAIIGDIERFKSAQNEAKPTRLEQLANKLSKKI